MRKLNKLEATCTAIINYCAENKGVLDDKGLGELTQTRDRLASYQADWLTARNALSACNARLAGAYDGLHAAIMVGFPRKSGQVIYAASPTDASRILS